jgi:hypothetical protein
LAWLGASRSDESRPPASSSGRSLLGHQKRDMAAMMATLIRISATRARLTSIAGSSLPPAYSRPGIRDIYGIRIETVPGIYYAQFRRKSKGREIQNVRKGSATSPVRSGR